MSQREKILKLLKERGHYGVHSYEGYRNYMPRIAAVINTLKKEGYNIQSLPDDGRWGNAGRHGCIYVLIQDGQTRMV